MNNKNLCKNLIIMMTAVGLVFSCTGCGSAFPNMTDSQMEEIGDYAGVVLLKYDASHRSRLVDVSEYENSEENDEITDESQTDDEKTDEPAKEASESEDKEEQSVATDDSNLTEPEVVDVSGEKAQEEIKKTFAEFVGMPEGVTITYAGSEWADEYSEEGAGSYFSLDASEGKMFFIVTYDFYNGSANDIDVDFLDAGFSFKAQIGNDTRTALPTMLVKDMSTYVGKIKSGSTEKLVLLFEFSKDAVNSLENTNIIVKSGNDRYTECIN